ncbi:hypothetical protein CPB86DRAFT_340661 [Serendipita vermifera]|nr:hypothetical protein CPB86DRAFT_340661 [Serendipita vermifera]
MFVRGTIQIWNLHEKRIVSTFNIGGYPLRWNHSVDKNGFTIIFYSSSIGKTFQVWRYDYRTGRSKQMHERELEGNLPFIWIEGELAGYVATTDDDMLFLYAFSMVTLREVGVNTTMKSLPNLSIFSSPNHLYLYSEESSSAFYEFYELEWLKARLHAPIEIITAPPQFHRDFEFKGRQLVSDNRWYSMCSRLWDGRLGVFSRSYTDETRGSAYISLAIVDEEAPSNECHPLTLYLAHWLRNYEIAQSISGRKCSHLEDSVRHWCGWRNVQRDWKSRPWWDCSLNSRRLEPFLLYQKWRSSR